MKELKRDAPLTAEELRELARKPELNFKEVLALTGARLGVYGLFRLTKEAIRFNNPLADENDPNMDVSDLMSLQDYSELAEWEKDVGELKFPCTPKELADYCERTHWELGLPDEFVEAARAYHAALWGMTAKPTDYERAVKQDSWTAREAICWLSGRHPDWCRGDIEAHYPEELDAVRRAIKAGIVTPEGSPPERWAEWWVSKGWPVPPELEYLLDSGNGVDTVSSGKVSSEMAEKAPESAGEPFYLNEPQNKDDWFHPIRDMAWQFRGETKRMPTPAKAWARLWDSPPPDFGITQGKDTGGEIALKMGGEYLSKSAFKKRWRRYTRRPK